jgi:hypothetical protein
LRAILIAALVALTVPAPVRAQISPGPLSRAHQALDGTTQCANCHGTSADAMPRLCVACHKEIGWLVAQGRGYHARAGKIPGKSCASCHPEHAGREFQMIAWNAGSASKFDHREAGWTLDGKHANAPCDKCHRLDFRTGAAAALSPRKGSAGWIGLDTACASCHQRDDAHRNALGTACQTCHDAAAWKPAPKFNHASSRYPLTGKHSDVSCDKCHLAASLAIPVAADGRRTPRFKPVPFAECSSCHADPHRGQLSARCSTCHVTRGFDVIDRREFNHAATRYPLLGKHRAVSCEGCHGRGMARPKPAFETCADCHADAHAGEATLGGAHVDCAACHQVAGFAPATYTVAQHRATRFPLGGKHELVACAACHKTATTADRSGKVVQIRVASTDCVSCHADVHAGQLAGGTCARCHSDAGWTAIRYDRAAHAATRLPLEGSHASLSCVSCHGSTRSGLPALPSGAAVGSAGVLFRLPEIRCAACHADPHRTSGAPTARDSAGCERCHTAANFRRATIGVAAHARFAFVLEGAHRAVPCATCHTNFTPDGGPRGTGTTLVGDARATTAIALNSVRGTRCAACHQSPHGAQFASRRDGGACEACHASETFAPAPRFNHDRDARFPLAGAHARVACAQCHRTETVAGVAQVIYRPVPHRCEDCHAGKRPGGGR